MANINLKCISRAQHWMKTIANSWEVTRTRKWAAVKNEIALDLIASILVLASFIVNSIIPEVCKRKRIFRMHSSYLNFSKSEFETPFIYEPIKYLICNAHVTVTGEIVTKKQHKAYKQFRLRPQKMCEFYSFPSNM